jgi:transcriptional regulator with XRE-family HTH domain
MELRRVRNYLGLSQIIVSVATGISIGRLSGAENGQLTLNRTEKAVLEDFYRAKLQILAEAKRDGAE